MLDKPYGGEKVGSVLMIVLKEHVRWVMGGASVSQPANGTGHEGWLVDYGRFWGTKAQV